MIISDLIQLIYFLKIKRCDLFFLVYLNFQLNSGVEVHSKFKQKFSDFSVIKHMCFSVRTAIMV